MNNNNIYIVNLYLYRYIYIYIYTYQYIYIYIYPGTYEELRSRMRAALEVEEDQGSDRVGDMHVDGGAGERGAVNTWEQMNALSYYQLKTLLKQNGLPALGMYISCVNTYYAYIYMY